MMQVWKIEEITKVIKARKARRILFTDIDGTVYQWQLLIDLVLAIAKHYSAKRPIVAPLRKAISEYKKRVLSFSVVINILITIIPNVFKGIDKNHVKRIATARAHRVGTMVYVFPKTLIDVVLAITDDPWLVVAITGSPQEVADPFCKQRGIHVVIGSDYKCDRKGIYTGERDIDSGIKKGVYLSAIAEACPEINWQESIVLGDSEHDFDMFEYCGHAIAINPNTALVQKLRGSSKAVAMVRDGQKSGVQVFMPNISGILVECCANCILPEDVARVFPLLPGMLEPEACACAA